MKKIASIICITSLLFMSGCAFSLKTPVTGFVFSEVQGPGEISSNATGSKTGTAECTSILGAVAFGDARIETAAKNGGIKKIVTVHAPSEKNT